LLPPLSQRVAPGLHTPLHVPATHAFVAQSVLLKHCTHCDVLPEARQCGVLPLQAVQLVPQLASAAHVTHAPLLHCVLLLQGVSVCG
jgi:hypothetical protein